MLGQTCCPTNTRLRLRVASEGLACQPKLAACAGVRLRLRHTANRRHASAGRLHRCERRMERETGIEPATNSLEGCDSTTELLPPLSLPTLAAGCRRRHRPAFEVRPQLAPTSATCHRRSPSGRLRGYGGQPSPAARAKAGGEGRIRTSEAAWATDLQSVAFDRSATSPDLLPDSVRPAVSGPAGLAPSQPTPPPGARSMELAKGFEPPTR